ncbi:response regulator [Microbacterium saccharophilum]|uniref:Response regulator n=1 Tax=Microbacterium saccharophilum TaxID=1213358 RepID=A0A5C8HUH3_9MICO|nr:response regulator [Microbacterium saccharophilum]TXK08793.1 response regulator [Microbacterium saccharophilum]
MSVHPEGSGVALPALLYVEDDAEIAVIVVEMLGEHYRVHHVVDGEAALSAALSRRFDVMLVDRRLPGISGADFVRAIRTAHLATGPPSPTTRRRSPRGLDARRRSSTG